VCKRRDVRVHWQGEMPRVEERAPQFIIENENVGLNVFLVQLGRWITAEAATFHLARGKCLYQTLTKGAPGFRRPSPMGWRVDVYSGPVSIDELADGLPEAKPSRLARQHAGVARGINLDGTLGVVLVDLGEADDLRVGSRHASVCPREEIFVGNGGYPVALESIRGVIKIEGAVEACAHPGSVYIWTHKSAIESHGKQAKLVEMDLSLALLFCDVTGYEEGAAGRTFGAELNID
jgi:hypothetical protein